MWKIAAISLAGAWVIWSQSAAPLSFEVASIKSSQPNTWRESRTGEDRIDFPYVSPRTCIAFAYGVKEFQVSGPSWLAELRFDILAKGPEGTRREQLHEMMRTLLDQRFHLQAHQETREYQVYTLEVAKGGLKLQESAPDPNAPEGAAFGMSMTGSGVGRLEGKRANMTSLANTLARMLGRPVVDRTGLTGRYDLELEFSKEDTGGMRTISPPAGPMPGSETTASIFASLQLVGLRLESRKVPMPAIVVDQMDKTATEN